MPIIEEDWEHKEAMVLGNNLETIKLTKEQKVELSKEQKYKEWIEKLKKENDENLGKYPYFYVVRTYSGHASKKRLVKVMSRRFKSELDANDWKDFEESQEKNKRHKFTVVRALADQLVL